MALKSKKQETRGFKYQKRTKDDLKERANMKGGNYDTLFKPKFKQWKPKEGKNLIRILPPTWDMEDTPWQTTAHYGLDIYVNYSIGADNQSYLSLAKHGKGDDPLTEARREAQQEGDKKLAKALSPNQRILYWIIDRNDEDEGPLLWAAPFTFDKSLSNLCIDEDTKDVMFIDNPEDGRDIRFYKEGTGLTTKYDPSKMKVLAESTIAEDEGLEQEWLDFISDNPLSEVLNFYDYDHIKATFDGVAGRDDDDEDAKPTTKRTRAKAEDDVDEKPKRHRGPRHDEEDGEADDEPEEKPVRGKRKAEPEEDEPEEKPARKRTRAKAEDEDEPELPLKSRRGKTEPDEDEGGSLRERLARRRSRSNDDD